MNYNVSVYVLLCNGGYVLLVHCMCYYIMVTMSYGYTVCKHKFSTTGQPGLVFCYRMVVTNLNSQFVSVTFITLMAAGFNKRHMIQSAVFKQLVKV